MSTALDRLREVLGAGGYVDSAAAIEPYLVDWRKLYRGTAPFVARPDTVERVAAVMRICAEYGVGVVPHGGNTGYCGGATPREQGREIILSLARLSRIRDVDPDGYSIVVDAGCTLAAVQEAALKADRLFPLSLGSEGTAQIGGNLSTNAGGTAVLRYGMIRDLVLGLEVVLPDGRVLDQLSCLRKDNTGYDVKQLFIGAEGTLGVITGAALKLFPLPNEFITAFVAIGGIADAVVLLGRMRNAFGDTVSTFEYLPRIAHELAVKHIPGTVVPFDRPYPAYVLVELGLPKALAQSTERFEEFLAGEIEAGYVRDAVIAHSGSQRDALWHLREHIPDAQSREGAVIKHDISLPVARLPQFVEAAERRLAVLAPGARIVNFGHIGDGNLHFNLSPPEGASRDDALRFEGLALVLNECVHRLVAELGGSFSAEHGIGRLKMAELERYEDPVALEIMHAIKSVLDPQRIMNPGKVLRVRSVS
jgi:FAD/FMN-containing dehydrogenase